MSRRIEWLYYFNVLHDYEMQLLLYHDFVFLWHSAKVKALCSRPVFGPSNWRISGVFCHSDFMETCQERRGLFTVGESSLHCGIHGRCPHIVTFYFIPCLPTSGIGRNIGQNWNLKKEQSSGTIERNVWLSYVCSMLHLALRICEGFDDMCQPPPNVLKVIWLTVGLGWGKCSVICC